MSNSNIFIDQMLTPAVLISAIGLILLGVNNRFLALTSRIRELNHELREYSHSSLPKDINLSRIEAVKKQIYLIIGRSRLVRNVIFLLYSAIACTILTVLALAMELAEYKLENMNPPIIFLVAAIIFILIAVSIEGYETSMALKSLKEDFNSTSEMLQEE